MATQLDEGRNLRVGEKVWARPVRFCCQQGRCVPWRDRKEHPVRPAVCLPLSPPLLWDKAHVWPLTASSELSRSHRILGPAGHPLGLCHPITWCVDTQLPGGTSAGRQGVALSYFKRCGQPHWLCLPSQPWTAAATVLAGAQGGEPTEEEEWMDGFCSEGFLHILLGKRAGLSVCPVW